MTAPASRRAIHAPTKTKSDKRHLGCWVSLRTENSTSKLPSGGGIRSLPRQPQQPRGILFKHDVQFPVGKTAGVHGFHKFAHAVEPAIYARRFLRPKFRHQAAFRTDLADGVRAYTAFIQHI